MPFHHLSDLVVFAMYKQLALITSIVHFTFGCVSIGQFSYFMSALIEIIAEPQLPFKFTGALISLLMSHVFGIDYCIVWCNLQSYYFNPATTVEYFLLQKWKLFSESILTHFLCKKKDKIKIFTGVILSNFLEKLMDFC